MKRTRILAISNSGEIIGGGEVSFCQMVSRLDEHKFEVTVMCPPGEGVWGLLREEGERERERGRGERGMTAEGAEGGCEDREERRGRRGRRLRREEVFEMPGLKGAGLLRLPGRVWKLARLMRRGGYDVVYANGSRCMIYAGLAARLAGCPAVWHVRIPEAERLDRLLVRLADRIVVNSQAVAERFGFLNGDSPPVKVVHNGVDLREFDPDLPAEPVRKEWGIEASAPLATILGRLDQWKGHHTFLRAAAQVAACAPRARFLVVGDGVERQRLEDQSSRLGLQGRVIFTGNRKDVPHILAASDLLVSASHNEAFGRVLIEAMAMCKPVVATRAGGVPEVVVEEETGLLVEPQDSSRLAQAICRLLQDAQLRQRLGQAGRRRVEQQFSARRHAREMERVLELAGGGRRQEAGGRRQEEGRRSQESGIRNQEEGYPEPGTGNPEPLPLYPTPDSRLPNPRHLRSLCIGLDVREWERGKMTGIGRYLLNFLAFAARQRPHFRFLLYGNQHSGFPELPQNAEPRIVRERLTFWWDQVSLGRKLRRDGVQLFLSPYPKVPLAAPCPCLTTIHDLLFLKVPDYAYGGKAVYNRLFQAGARLYSRRASRVITDSEHSRQDLIELLGLPSEKISVLPIGLLPHFRPVQDAAVCSRYGVSGRFVLYVGNFKPHKNLTRLLEAFRWLRERLGAGGWGLGGGDGDSLSLVLAGNDPKHRPGLEEKVAELGLEDSVVWTGLVEDAHLPALYSAAEVFVFPSLYEGFGLPALEAMACGTAVIASRTTSLPEVVGEAGLLVDPEDTSELGQAMLRLLTDQELRRDLEKRGLKRAQRFSLEATAGRLLDLIEQIAADHQQISRKAAKPQSTEA